MMRIKTLLAVVLFCSIQPVFAGMAAAGVLWLSESAPPKQKAAKPDEHNHNMHDHHAMAQSAVPVTAAAAPALAKKHDHSAEINLEGETPGKDHQPVKQVWLRRGDSIKNAEYVAGENGSERLRMIDLEAHVTDVVAESDGGRLSLKTDLPKVGFYDVYLEQRAVRDGRLEVQLPKAELLWASCVAKNVDEEAVAKPIINAAAPLELVRKHGADEGCMARLVSGDVVKFMVLSFGKPVAGVPVTLITQEGWRNTVESDATGHASFTLIRTYFPKWFEFRKYHTDAFLAVAEMETEEAGELNGKQYRSAHYVATLPGKYRPSPHDYRSYAWGLGIALFVIVFGGLSVYLYRRRRLKPYREERIDDKA